MRNPFSIFRSNGWFDSLLNTYAMGLVAEQGFGFGANTAPQSYSQMPVPPMPPTFPGYGYSQQQQPTYPAYSQPQPQPQPQQPYYPPQQYQYTQPQQPYQQPQYSTPPLAAGGTPKTAPVFGAPPPRRSNNMHYSYENGTLCCRIY